MQPQMTALPYRPDAVLDYFTPLAGQFWAMLLHSGNSSHPDSRYDILVAAPVVTLVTRDDVTEIRRRDDRESRHDDHFALVQQELMAAGMTALPNASLPFLGEALGYFGYDLARGIETLPALAKSRPAPLKGRCHGWRIPTPIASRQRGWPLPPKIRRKI